MNSQGLTASEDLVSLADVDISRELLARPISTPNKKRESNAMHVLAGALSQGVYFTLKQLANSAIELCNAGSAGISVIESTETAEVFRWRALAGVIEPYEGGSTPRDWSPCGECLKKGKAALYSYPARYFTYFQKLEQPIVEGLVIPMFRNAVPLGTIWIVTHTSRCRFDAEHVRIMASLGSFAASALQLRFANGGAAEEGTNGFCFEGDHRPETLGPAGESRHGREIVWSEYLRRVVQHDEFALEALLEETHALVFAAALRVIGFQVDAEEVAADVYARVWKTADAYDSRRGGVGTWLVGMARSIAIDRLRTRAVRNRSEAALLFQCACSDNPEAQADASETKCRLRQALQTLPFEQQRAIELFYFSELPIADIAAQLGQPIGTIKTRLRLGLLKLRRILAALESPLPKRKPVSRFSETQSSVYRVV